MTALSNAYIRLLPLPFHVEGCVLPNEDGSFDIYLNSRLPEECREKALLHELTHIKKDHLYDIHPVWMNEQEAG